MEVGSGEPILFLHNGGSGHWIWHYQIQHFAKKYRVFAFDMLGYGASDRPNVIYDLNFYTQMTDEIIEQLNLQNLILVGNCVQNLLLEGQRILFRNPKILLSLLMIWFYSTQSWSILAWNIGMAKYTWRIWRRKMFSSSKLYDQNTFYKAFEHDLKCCKRELIIESPFITTR